MPRDQVAAVLELLDRVLGDALLGAYLYGSAVDGGLRPDSDLDFLGVLGRSLIPEERRQLVRGLMPLSGATTRPQGWRPVELTLVVHDEIRPWRYPPPMELQYGEWLRESFTSGDIPQSASVSPDLAIVVAIVLDHGSPLIGPPARNMLDPVPPADLRRAIVDELPALMNDLRADTRNVLLTLARMWMTVSTGTIRPKDVAAEWALPQLPAEHRRLLDQARAAYLGESEDRWDDWAAVRSLGELLRDRIERAHRPLPRADASV